MSAYWQEQKVKSGRKKLFSLKNRIRFYKTLYRVSKRGQKITISLKGMSDRNSKKTIGAAYRNIYDRVMNGEKLAHILVGLPATELMLIAAAQNTGDLAPGFEQARFIAVAKQRIKNVLFGLIQPIVMVAVVFAVLTLVTPKVMPMLENMLSVDEWEPMAVLLYDLSKFTSKNALTIIGMVISYAVISMILLSRWSGQQTHTRKVRLWLDRYIPPFSIYRIIEQSGFLLALGSLMKAGTTVPVALKSMREQSNPWMRAHIDQMIFDFHNKDFKKGSDEDFQLAPAIDTGLIDLDTMGYLYDMDAAGAIVEEIKTMGQEVLEDTLESVESLSNKAAQTAKTIAIVLAAWLLLSLLIVAIDAVGKYGNVF